MVSHDTQIRAINQYNKTKRDGLDTETFRRLNSYDHHHRPNTVFVQSSSGSSSSILPTVLAVAGIAAAGVSIFGALGKSSGGGVGQGFGGFSASGAQGGGSTGSSKSTVATLDNAATSGDANRIQAAIQEGTKQSATLGQEIQTDNAAEQTATTAAKAADDQVSKLTETNKGLDGDIKTLGDAITQDDKDISDANADLAKAQTSGANGGADAAAVATAQAKLDAAKAKKTKDTDDKKAKEDQKTKNEAEIKKQQDISKTKKTEATDAKAKATKATQGKQQIDTKVQQLQAKLAETDKTSNTLAGGAIGAGAGVVAGLIIGKGAQGAIIGGVLGAGAGAAIGYATSDDAGSPQIAEAETPTTAPAIATAPQASTPTAPVATAAPTADKNLDLVADVTPKKDSGKSVDDIINTPEETFGTKIKATDDKVALNELKTDITEDSRINGKTKDELIDKINNKLVASAVPETVLNEKG